MYTELGWSILHDMTDVPFVFRHVHPHHPSEVYLSQTFAAWFGPKIQAATTEKKKVDQEWRLESHGKRHKITTDEQWTESGSLTEVQDTCFGLTSRSNNTSNNK